MKAEVEGDAKATRMGKAMSWGSAAADVLLLSLEGLTAFPRSALPGALARTLLPVAHFLCFPKLQSFLSMD